VVAINEGLQVRKFASILVYRGEPQSNAPIRLVTRLAASSGAHVTLADTMEQVPEATLRRLPENWDVITLVRKKKQDALGRVAARMRRVGVKPSAALLEGNTVDAVVDCIKTEEHDLLVIDAPVPGIPDGAREIIARLVSESPVPVLLARDQRRRGHPRILAAVDSATWRPRDADCLNCRLMEAALWLAGHLDGKIHVLHVWEPVAEGSMRWAGVSPAGVSEYHVAARTEIRQELKNAVKPYRAHISASQIHVETGEPRVVIPRFATDEGMDLIVIGHYARSGLTGRLLGNSADSLPATSRCSILVVPRQAPVEGRAF
jgi:universal stress protein E